MKRSLRLCTLLLAGPLAASGARAQAPRPGGAASDASPASEVAAPVAAAPPGAPDAPYSAPEYISRPVALPPGRDAGRVLRMTLAEAIEMAMRRNLALNLQREATVQADTFRSLALGAWEPRLQAFTQRSVSKSPPSTRQEGQQGQVLRNENTTWSLGLSEHLPTGGDLSLGVSSTESESSLGTAVAPKVVRTSLSIDVAQPLLQGFSITGRVQTAPLLRARFGSERAREEARLRALVTVNRTENVYWDLVGTLKSYEVTASSLELARRQLELTRRQIAAGSRPESDLISAEATLAQRELSLVRAELQIDQASDLLRQIINLPEAEWERPLLPSDTPSFLPVEVSVAPALARALAGRPELRSAQLDYKQIALDLDLAKNARLPRLDLQGGYRTVGQDPSFGESFDQARHATGKQWNVGASFAWAPFGVAARAEVRRLESMARASGLGREQIVLDLRAEIRNAVRALQTAERQLRAAARSRTLSERSLDVEQRRFASGLADNFVIAQRQAELESARQAELLALVQHEKAASDLQLATGDLLEARKLVFSVAP